MQAAYVDVETVAGLVSRLREGARPLLLAATGTDGRARTVPNLAGRLSELRSRLRLVK